MVYRLPVWLSNVLLRKVMTRKIKTNVFILLDSSGSMKKIRKETIAHVNEQIKIAKASQNNSMECSLSLFTFHEEVNEILFDVPIEEVNEIDYKSYLPQGMTSVIDAISEVLSRAESLESEDSFLFCILSDGSDNSSKISTSEISRRINHLQENGNWTFALMGANQDLEKTRLKLKIPKGNIVKYESHSLGVSTLTETQSKSLGYFFTARSYGTLSTKGFYGSDK
jgi:uncharacterized protein YegL